jgi:4-hydroxyphenylpyruvate dioxygenase
MLHGLFYAEFLAQSVPETKAYFEAFGLSVWALREEGSGVWLRNGTGMSVIVREAVTQAEKAKLTRSGTCVIDISYLVSDVDELLRNVREASKTVRDMNVTTDVGRVNGGVRYVQLFFPRPGLRHSLFESNDFNLLLDGWKLCEMNPSASRSSGAEDCNVVSYIDHIAIACLGGTMKAIVEWYELALSLKQKMGVITIKTELGDGLRLASLYHKDESKNETFCQLTFVESVSISGDGENQVTTFLKNHGGPGVQHMAFLSHNIFASRSLLASRGVQFLAAPPGYYELPHMAAQAEVAGLELGQLEEGAILFDNEPESMDLDDLSAGTKYLLQVFTRSPFPRNTCFFELITRGNHREGFGAGNIRNLFRAVALERKSRIISASSTEEETDEDRAVRVRLMYSLEGSVHESVSQLLLSPRVALPPRRAHVVVVGSTICGLATALALARHKIMVVTILFVFFFFFFKKLHVGRVDWEGRSKSGWNHHDFVGSTVASAATAGRC